MTQARFTIYHYHGFPWFWVAENICRISTSYPILPTILVASTCTKTRATRAHIDTQWIHCWSWIEFLKSPLYQVNCMNFIVEAYRRKHQISKLFWSEFSLWWKNNSETIAITTQACARCISSVKQKWDYILARGKNRKLIDYKIMTRS